MKSPELSNLEIAYLCRELALLLHAGISEANGLYLMAEESRDNQMQELLNTMEIGRASGRERV